MSLDLRHTNEKRANVQEKYVLDAIDTYFTGKGFVRDIDLPETNTRERSLVEAIKHSMTGDEQIIRAKKTGGRGYNYDIEIVCNVNGFEKSLLYEIKGSSKGPCSRMENLPQVLSLATKHEAFSANDIPSYAEYFYSNWITKFNEALSTMYTHDLPSKEEYLKYVHNTDYKKHEWFMYAKEHETTESASVVDLSIHSYLVEYSSRINVHKIIETLKNTQLNKTFLFEECRSETWYMDGFLDCHFAGTPRVSLKAGKPGKYHTLVITLDYCKYECLLRWKNHKGVLYPAWQIKAIRT